MEFNIRYALLVLLVAGVTHGRQAAPSTTDTSVIQRLEMLEKRQRESEQEVQRLQGLTMDQSVTIQELRTETAAQKQTIAELSERLGRNEVQQFRIYQDAIKQCSRANNAGKVDGAEQSEHQTRMESTGIKRQASEKLAFTAYTDKPMTPSPTEIIKFDQVLTNLGGGYNIDTGMFTANQDGLYMFSFTISEAQENHFIWADLLVNGAKQIETAAETFHKDQDVQGSNMAVVNLQSGDLVWVATRTATQLPGGAAYRLTTFTGVFLY